MRMRKQSGFTIIELVVVIILLGIMAATALPRFMDVTDDAHGAVVDGVQGGLQSGTALFHAQWVAQGQPAANTQFTDYNSLRNNVEGYPYGTVDNTSNGEDVDTDADCAAVFTNVLQAGAPTVSSVNYNSDFWADESPTDDCLYYYTGRLSTTGDNVRTLAYDSETGAITQSTANLP